MFGSPPKNVGLNPAGSTNFFIIMKSTIKLFGITLSLATLLFVAGLFTGKRIMHYDTETIHLKECDLKYWETKSLLVNEVQNYINKVAPTSDLRAIALVDACENYSIDIKFALAQGEIESHFGTKGLASKTNSVWNVGAFTDYKYSEIMSTYKYAHPNESIEPYLKLLYNNYLTAEMEIGLLNNFVDHNGNRYASDTQYEERLSYRYKTIAKETKIDSLATQMHYWSIKSNR